MNKFSLALIGLTWLSLFISSKVVNGFIILSKTKKIDIIPDVKVLSDNSIPSIEAYIKKTLDENKVFVVSKSYCTYSRKVKKALTDFNVPYHVADLDIIEYGDCIHDYLKTSTNKKTVPYIYIDKAMVENADSMIRSKNFVQVFEKKLMASFNPEYYAKAKRQDQLD